MSLGAEDIFAVLREIPDPEMPIDIVSLGLIETVRVAPGVTPGASTIIVEAIPTFVGCPALEMIRTDIVRRLSALEHVESVEVRWRNEPPWSVDRISEQGREALRVHGVVVDTHACATRAQQAGAPQRVELRTSALPCPFCGSGRTRLDSIFGPTRCRSIYVCDACRNTFESVRDAPGAAALYDESAPDRRTPAT